MRWILAGLLALGAVTTTGCLRVGFEIVEGYSYDAGDDFDGDSGAPGVGDDDASALEGIGSRDGPSDFDGEVDEGDAAVVDGSIADGSTQTQDGAPGDIGEICPTAPQETIALATAFAWAGTRVGDHPVVDLATADLDADGHLDVVALVLGPLEPSTVVDNPVLLRGNGQGGFERVPVSQGFAPELHQKVVVQDLDLDGWLDVLSLSSGHDLTGSTVQGRLRVFSKGLLGDFVRSGEVLLPFEAPTAHLAGLAVADFTGDAMPDVAIGVGDPWGEQFVRVYEGRASIGLSSGSSYADIGGARWEIGADLVAADLNGDGLTDLAMASRTQIAYLERTSPSSFAPFQDLVPAQYPGGVDALASGDLNGDGRTDLVSIAAPNVVWALLSRTVGGFAAPVTLPIEGARRPILGDFNGDLRVDVAAIDPDEDGIQVALSDSSELRAGPRMRTLRGTRVMSSGDFDEDGALDLVFASAGTGSVVLLRGTGSGCFPTRGGYQVSGVQDGHRVRLGDLNNDGRTDIISEMRTYSSLHLGTAFGDPQVSRTIFPGSGSNITASDARASDFDGDGITDIAFTFVHLGLVAVFRGTGGPFPGTVLGPAPFEAPDFYPLPVDTRPTAVVAADLTGDGREELIVSMDDATASSLVIVFVNDGGGSFTSSSWVRIASAAKVHDAMVEEVTGDGMPDLITVSSNLSSVAVFPGLGDGTLAATPIRTALSAREAHGLETLDFDDDGHTDLVVTDASSDGVVLLLRGDSTGAFREVGRHPLGASESAAVADLAGDGRAELAVASWERNGVFLFEVSSAGSLREEASIGLPSPRAIAAADLDGDGDIDLVVNGDDQTLTVLYNQRR